MNRRVLIEMAVGIACLGLAGPGQAGERRVVLEQPSQATKLFGTGDVLVTHPAMNAVRPSMTSAPNGDLFVAVDDRDSDWLHVYRSTDGGRSWANFAGFSTPGFDVRNPSIAYGEHSGGEEWVYVAYELVNSIDDYRTMEVFRVDPDGVDYRWVAVEGPYLMNAIDDEVHPQIITDLVDWGDQYFVYLTYPVFDIDGYPVHFSRSVDRGESWSAPLDVRGTSPLTGWSTRPEIAYGKTAGLFITFVKPGSNGASVSNQIWVARSANFGASFSTPVQVTEDTPNVFHSSIAVTHGTNTVLVVFTRDWGGSDLDVAYKYSTDTGATWPWGGDLAWTPDHESSVDLAVSDSDDSFHVAYHREAVAGGARKVWYARTSAAAPGSWTSPEAINDGDTASGIADYPRPAIALIRPEGEPAIAWTDSRGLTDGVYFDTLEIFSDGFESGDTTQWSASVP
jgi:hypothetical protein